MSNEDIYSELKKITRLLTFAYADKIEQEIAKIATTNERKMIWVLIDGIKTSDEIAKRCKTSVRSVTRFQKLGEDADFINNPWGKPASRKIDYIPPEWIELLPKELDEEKEKHE